MCPRLEAQLATIDRGGGGDPGESRANPPLRGSRVQAAGRTRARHLAGQAPGLRQFRVLLAVQRPVRAMRSGQHPDPADARQSRPDHHQPRAAARRQRFGNPERDNQRRSVLLALAQNNCGPQYANAARGGGNFLDNLFGNNNVTRRAAFRSRSAIRDLPHRLRAHLRRRLFPDLVRHGAEPVSRRREDLQEPLPGGRSHAVRLSQSRRRHEPGGVDHRPTLFVDAERVPLSQRIRPVVLPARPSGKPGRMR